jgi:AcrR family transcriptional regulator
MTNPVSNPSKHGKEASCEAILDAAEELLARYGYKRMTMDDLAHAVGLSKGALYLRFNSKEDVAISSVDRINRRLRTRLQHLVEHKHDPVERVRLMLQERIMFRYDSVRSYCESFDEVYAALRPLIMERRQQYMEEERKIFVAALKQGAREGAFHLDDIEDSASMLLLATNGLLPYRLYPDELGKRKELHERVSRLADFLIQSLTNTGNDAAPANGETL